MAPFPSKRNSNKLRGAYTMVCEHIILLIYTLPVLLMRRKEANELCAVVREFGRMNSTISFEQSPTGVPKKDIIPSQLFVFLIYIDSLTAFISSFYEDFM